MNDTSKSPAIVGKIKPRAYPNERKVRSAYRKGLGHGALIMAVIGLIFALVTK